MECIVSFEYAQICKKMSLVNFLKIIYEWKQLVNCEMKAVYLLYSSTDKTIYAVY